MGNQQKPIVEHMELCSMLCASLERRRVWGRMDTCTGFPCGSAGKESACNVGNLGLIPGLGRYPEEGKYPPVFWPGEFHGLYSPQGHKESDTTE